MGLPDSCRVWKPKDRTPLVLNQAISVVKTVLKDNYGILVLIGK